MVVLPCMHARWRKFPPCTCGVCAGNRSASPRCDRFPIFFCFVGIQNFSLPPFTTSSSSQDGASVALLPISRQQSTIFTLFFQVQVKNSAKANKSHVPCQFPLKNLLTAEPAIKWSLLCGELEGGLPQYSTAYRSAQCQVNESLDMTGLWQPAPCRAVTKVNSGTYGSPSRSNQPYTTTD